MNRVPIIVDSTVVCFRIPFLMIKFNLIIYHHALLLSINFRNYTTLEKLLENAKFADVSGDQTILLGSDLVDIDSSGKWCSMLVCPVP